MTIQNDDTLLVGRDDLVYYSTLENSGLATLNFVENLEININESIAGLGNRLQVIESGWDFSVSTEISTLRNFKVGDDDLFVNVANNHVGIGTHNPQKSLDIVSSDSSNRATARVSQWSNDNKGPWFSLNKGRGSEASKSKIQFGDTIGELYFVGYNGSNTTAATVRCSSVASNNEGYGKLDFKTRGADGLKSRLYTQPSGQVVVTKGLVLSTEDAGELGTFAMKDFTDSSEPMMINFTKYRGNNPAEFTLEELQSSYEGLAPSANIEDRLLPGDGVVHLTFGGWNGSVRRNLATFAVTCLDDELTGEVSLKTKKVNTDGVADRITIDGDGNTHIKNGDLTLHGDLAVGINTVTRIELSRLTGLNANAQTQFDDRIKKSELLQIVQEETTYEGFRSRIIDLLT